MGVMSLIGTSRKCRHGSLVSVTPENICSLRDLPVLTEGRRWRSSHSSPLHLQLCLNLDFHKRPCDLARTFDEKLRNRAKRTVLQSRDAGG